MTESKSAVLPLDHDFLGSRTTNVVLRTQKSGSSGKTATLICHSSGSHPIEVAEVVRLGSRPHLYVEPRAWGGRESIVRTVCNGGLCLVSSRVCSRCSVGGSVMALHCGLCRGRGRCVLVPCSSRLFNPASTSTLPRWRGRSYCLLLRNGGMRVAFHL